MEKILPKVKPQPVPLDHPVHNGVPFLPVVAPHGGRVAWGWVADGRMAAYYHPGDVGDAWADGHAGVPRHVWESSYRLGGNVLLYAHSEYSRWLTAKNQTRIVAAAAALLLPGPLTAAKLTWLEQIEVNTFGELRQVERYQLKTAERFYTKGEYAAAAAEYEKFITLYETSAGAPYAQLMWSHCQVKQRKVYTGIRDGFQSVIDYWPESTEAMLASYLIGQSYKSIGELKKAEIAYGKAVNSHPEKHIAVLSKGYRRDRQDSKKETPDSGLTDLVFNRRDKNLPT